MHFGADYILDEMCILVEMCILECIFGAHVYICILVVMHKSWRRCVFGRTYLNLHFDCNAHILEDVRAFGESYLHFSCNAHLFLRRCILKYNYIHMFTEEMTLIKYYCNLYHISLRIKENKINFARWMHKSHSNIITSHFKYDLINQTSHTITSHFR